MLVMAPVLFRPDDKIVVLQEADYLIFVCVSQMRPTMKQV
jgi:hypothetical protein